METREVAERVRTVVSDYLAKNDTELVEVIYRRESEGMVLRLLVDTPNGITLNECEAINRDVSELLDKADIITERYILEVSSPGLDRRLVSDGDFRRCMGKALNVSVFEPVDGKREHRGTLVGIDADGIVLESNGVSVYLQRSKIAKAIRHIDI